MCIVKHKTVFWVFTGCRVKVLFCAMHQYFFFRDNVNLENVWSNEKLFEMTWNDFLTLSSTVYCLSQSSIWQFNQQYFCSKHHSYLLLTHWFLLRYGWNKNKPKSIIHNHCLWPNSENNSSLIRLWNTTSGL